jgi:hypothetical protein
MKLTNFRKLIVSDSRKHADEDNEEDLFDLSSTYAALCGQIWQSDGFRKFALIGEMMDMMLRTKVSQSSHLLKPI